MAWLLFNLFLAALLVLDLAVFHRRAHAVSLREAATWSAMWIGLALLFGAGIYFFSGSQAAAEFLTGYLVEKALSLDNVFVIALILGSFAVPAAVQHRVLFWGVFGALVMRGGFILGGVALLERFHWLLYVFGGFLLLTGARLALSRPRPPDLARHPAVRLVRRVLPVSETYVGGRLLLRRDGRWLATPLLLALVLVETSDLLFAVDSIPAVLAVSRDPFVVYTSNAFALLGLRSLYFLLAGGMGRLRYLQPALALILMLVGAKLLLAEVYPVPAAVSLVAIVTVLGAAVLASLRGVRGVAAVAAGEEG